MNEPAIVLDARSLRAWVARYLEAIRTKHYSERTVVTSEKLLGGFLAWCETRALGRPEEITKPILERYQRFVFQYRKANGRPLALSTQLARLVAVRGFFRWLARQNAILSNPASDLELPRKGQRLPHHVLTPGEVERVLSMPNVRDGLGLRDRTILEVLYGTGMRRQELVTLGIYDIDTERGTVRIRHGKGNKERVVPIGERALAWIGKYLDVVRPELVVSVTEETLFLNRLGEPMGPDALTGRVRGYVNESGIGKKGSCHLFRHTMATLMLEGGADVRYVQEMLGHTKLETTQIYTQVSIHKLREVYLATHPAARLGKAPLRPHEGTSEAIPVEAEELTVLADEAGEEDGVANETKET